jgi:predicted enzyme related to lactoylglutathione lyase
MSVARCVTHVVALVSLAAGLAGCGEVVGQARRFTSRIVSAPIDGPFGRTFTFADPDGYQVTLHDRV